MVTGNGDVFHLARNGRVGDRHAEPISERSPWQGQPPSAGVGSLSAEENRDMITANRIQDPLDRLAAVAERYMDFLEREARANEAEKDQHDERILTPLKEKEWFTPEEAGVELKRKPSQIRELCRRKVFGKRDSGRKWWIHKKEIEAFRLGRIMIHGEVF